MRGSRQVIDKNITCFKVLLKEVMFLIMWLITVLSTNLSINERLLLLFNIFGQPHRTPEDEPCRLLCYGCGIEGETSHK